MEPRQCVHHPLDTNAEEFSQKEDHPTHPVTLTVLQPRFRTDCGEHINKCLHLVNAPQFGLILTNDPLCNDDYCIFPERLFNASAVKKIFSKNVHKVTHISPTTALDVTAIFRLIAALKDEYIHIVIEEFRNQNLKSKLKLTPNKKLKVIKQEDLLDLPILSFLSFRNQELWPCCEGTYSIQDYLDCSLKMKFLPYPLQIKGSDSPALLRFQCTYPSCGCCFDSKEDYLSHYNSTHPCIEGLNPFWNDLITWTRLTTGQALLKNLFIEHSYHTIFLDDNHCLTSVVPNTDDYLSSNNINKISFRNSAKQILLIDRTNGIKSIMDILKFQSCIQDKINLEEIDQDLFIYSLDMFNDHLLDMLRVASDLLTQVDSSPFSKSISKTSTYDIEDDANLSVWDQEFDDVKIIDADLKFDSLLKEEFDFSNLSISKDQYLDELMKTMLDFKIDSIELNRLIRGFNTVSLEEDLSIDLDMDILTALKISHLPLPEVGFKCPIDQCHFNSKTEKGLKVHHYKMHKDIRFFPQPYNLLSRIWKNSPSWYMVDEDGNSSLPEVCTCLVPGCDYVSSHNKLSAHYESKHCDLNHFLLDLGPFWASILYYTTTNKKLPTLYEYVYSRPLILCPLDNCKHATSCSMSHRLHYISHDLCVIKNTQAPSRKGFLVFVEEDELQEVVAEITKTLSAENNEIAEIDSDSSIPLTKEDVEVDISTDLPLDTNLSNNLRDTPSRNTARRHRNKSRIPKTRKPFRCTPSERLQTIAALDKSKKLEKLKNWVAKYSKEEAIGFRTIMLDTHRRIKIVCGLEAKFKCRWVPLFDTFLNEDWSLEEGRIAINGITLKFNHDVRKHVAKALNFDQKLKPRNTNNSTIKNEGKKIAARLKSEENNKFIRNLVEYFTLVSCGINCSTTINRCTRLELELSNYCSKRGESWSNDVFGGSSIENIRNAADDTEDHRETKVNWIKDKLLSEESDTTNLSKEEISNLRDSFKDNPKMILRRSILPTSTPNTSLTANDFMAHYGKTWAAPVDTFVEASDEQFQMWKVSNVIDSLKHDFIKDSLLDLESIEQTIKTRRHLASIGPDGISNSIFKLCANGSAVFLKKLFTYIVQYEAVPDSWKNSRTVFLYKKGDPGSPSNWRPVGITSCTYRIFAAQLAKAIQNINSDVAIFSSIQKGFIANQSGCLEHVAFLNESILDADRFNSEIHMLAVDFTNAFGNVSHKLFLSILKQKGFPEFFINIIADIYKNNFTYIEVNGSKSDRIQWKRGVLQGCPLAPLLFNLCIDPLLHGLDKSDYGLTVNIGSDSSTEKIKISSQAYADDVVIIGSSQDDVQHLLDIIDDYCYFSKMELAPHKCIALSNTDNPSPYQFRDKSINTLKSDEVIKYLGAPVSRSTLVKLKSLDEVLTSCEQKIVKIMNSQLTIVQKAYALRTFIYPKIDYLMLNSSHSISKLKKFDAHIRGLFNKLTRCPGTPQSFHHLSGKKGGLGIPELSTRACSLKICAFGKLMHSNDNITKTIFNQYCENEINLRNWKFDPQSPFLGLAIKDNGEPNQLHSNGTRCLLIEAFNSAKYLNVCINKNSANQSKISWTNNGINQENVVATNKDWAKILKKYLDGKYLTDLTSLPFHGHSFTTTHQVTSSNSIMKSKIANKSDSLIKFTIAARTNNLGTPELLAKKSLGAEPPHCKACLAKGIRLIDSLMHRLNGCVVKKHIFKYRHNLVENSIVAALKRQDKSLAVLQSCSLHSIDTPLPEDVRTLRPDITCIKGDECKLIEISVPYGSLKDTDNEKKSSLSITFNHKMEKYANLANAIEQNLGLKVSVHAIIVSSLGAIPSETSAELSKLFKSNKARKALEKKLSYDALVGSAVIYYKIPARYLGDGRKSPYDDQLQSNNSQDHSNPDQEEIHISPLDDTNNNAADDPSNYINSGEVPSSASPLTQET